MTHKAKLTIVAILSCCALFSMGFANWVITQAPQSVTGTITADDVMYSNDYLYKVSITGFNYTYRGFLDANGNLIDNYTGTMSVTYEVDFELCKKLYEKENITSVMVGITLGYTETPEKNSNMFAQGNEFVSANVDGKPIAGTIEKDTFKITFNVPVPQEELTDSNKTKQIKIEYTFEFGNADDYMTYVYDAFNETDLQFEFNASLTKGGN